MAQRDAKPEKASDREKKLELDVQNWKTAYNTAVSERNQFEAIAEKHTVTFPPEASTDKVAWISVLNRSCADAPMLKAIEILKKECKNQHTTKAGVKIKFEMQFDNTAWKRVSKSGWTHCPELQDGDRSIVRYGTAEYIVPEIDTAFDNYISELVANSVIQKGIPDTGDLPVRVIVSMWYWGSPTPVLKPEIKYIEVPVAVTKFRETLHPEDVPTPEHVHEQEQNDKAARLAAELELDPELKRKVAQHLSSQHVS